MVTWQRFGGYEVSSQGDRRFSAMFATLSDKRTIEQWYQCDIKGYDIGGREWRKGKGKSPLFRYPDDQLWELYLSLWRLWTVQNSRLMIELAQLAAQQGNILSDRFATTQINQARALAQILNEWF